MGLPEKAADVLRSRKVEYRVEEIDSELLAYRLARGNPKQAQMATASLLKLGGKSVLALCATQAMISLDLIGSDDGETAESTSRDAISELLAVNGLDLLPTLPGVLNCPTLVDTALTNCFEVYLQSGRRDVHLVLKKNEFSKLIGDSPVREFALPLAMLEPDQTPNKVDDREDLNAAVRNYTSLRIQKALTETLEIPPLSATTQKIINLSADPTADAEDLVQIVELDPSLAAQIVGWAASPYYSAPGEITSIHDAIVRVLGFDLVMNLALGLSLGKALKLPDDCPDGITPYWRQSVYCALTMEKLNQCLPAERRGIPGMVYLSGLLNNFGYLVLAHVFSNQFSRFCRYSEANPHVNHKYIENYLLGITRDQACAQLMEAWNLPECVCTALRYQQFPEYDQDHGNYANLLLLAKRMLAAKGIGDQPAEAIPPAIFDRLGLKPDDAEVILSGMLEIADEIDRMMDIFPD